MVSVPLQSIAKISDKTFKMPEKRNLTVRPFDRVVHSVFIDWWMGVANPRLIGCTALSAPRLRRAWFKLRASRREAIAGELISGLWEEVKLV